MQEHEKLRQRFTNYKKIITKWKLKPTIKYQNIIVTTNTSSGLQQKSNIHKIMKNSSILPNHSELQLHPQTTTENQYKIFMPIIKVNARKGKVKTTIYQLIKNIASRDLKLTIEYQAIIITAETSPDFSKTKQ